MLFLTLPPPSYLACIQGISELVMTNQMPIAPLIKVIINCDLSYSYFVRV